MGQEWADLWSKEAASQSNENKSIILSRSPIDVVRMSDHTWHSCHSPNDSYFENAIEEAKEGGAIAYVVDNDDLAKFIESEGEEALQQQEIFKDRQRGIEGIVPLARARVNRYINDEEEELALPVLSTYGDEISGFLDSLTSWLQKEQEDYLLNADSIDMNEYKRTGGGYADLPDKKIIENFFGDNMGVYEDLEHVGGEARFKMWSEELNEMQEIANSFLKYSSISGEVIQDDGYIYIVSDGEMRFKFRGTYTSDADEESVMEQLNNERMFSLSTMCGHVESLEWANENGYAIITLRFNLSYNEVMNSPDDWSDKADEYKAYERDQYFAEAPRIQRLFEEAGALVGGDGSDDWREYLEEYGNGAFEVSPDDDAVLVDFVTGVDLSKLSAMNGDNAYDRESLKLKLKPVINQLLVTVVKPIFDASQNQMDFDFAESRAYMDIQDLVPDFNLYVSNTKNIEVQMEIPFDFIMQIGKSYVDALLKSHEQMNRAIGFAIQSEVNKWVASKDQASIEQNDSNAVEASTNWYKLCKIKR